MDPSFTFSCSNVYLYSMLVNIYGSKDLFVSEYRTLLADRILSTFNNDTEKEVSISLLTVLDL